MPTERSCLSNHQTTSTCDRSADKSTSSYEMRCLGNRKRTLHSKNASSNQTSQAPIKHSRTSTKALLTSQNSHQIQGRSREPLTSFYTIKSSIKTNENKELHNWKNKCKNKKLNNSRKSKHFSDVKVWLNNQNPLVHLYISVYINKDWKIRNQDKSLLMEIKKIDHRKL